MEDIYSLWFSLLDDNVFSVREDAAAALCDVIQAYGQPALDKILPVLRYSITHLLQIMHLSLNAVPLLTRMHLCLEWKTDLQINMAHRHELHKNSLQSFCLASLIYSVSLNGRINHKI